MKIRNRSKIEKSNGIISCEWRLLVHIKYSKPQDSVLWIILLYDATWFYIPCIHRSNALILVFQGKWKLHFWFVLSSTDIISYSWINGVFNCVYVASFLDTQCLKPSFWTFSMVFFHVFFFFCVFLTKNNNFASGSKDFREGFFSPSYFFLHFQY